jgi:hypothetical protein
MSKRRGRGIYGLEDAPPAKSTKRVRPVAGQKPPTLDEALASVALTVGVRLIERLLAPSPVAQAVMSMPRQHTVLRKCAGIPETRDRCGARYVDESWRICPFCGDMLEQVPS